VPERKTDLVPGVYVWDALDDSVMVRSEGHAHAGKEVLKTHKMGIRLTLSVNQARYVVPQLRQICFGPLQDLGQGG
jgi:hypothetical protein